MQTMKDSYVLVRCTAAGVHAGILVSRNGQEVHLREARRLWYWRVPFGAPAFLSGVATHGLGEDCKVGGPVEIILTEACEVIACTDQAAESIANYPSHRRSI